MTHSWLSHFDVVIVGGNKPAFLMDADRYIDKRCTYCISLTRIHSFEHRSLPLFRVDPTSPDCALTNIEEDLPSLPPCSTAAVEREVFLRKGKVFQGGHATALQALLGLPSGDRLLYVGDHMYADVLKAKRTCGWRTCLVVPELTEEIIAIKKNREVGD